MSDILLDAYMLRPPFELEFPANGGVVVNFPAGQVGSGHDPVCVDLSGGDFSISIPANSSVVLPSGDNIKVTLNDKESPLPIGGSNRPVITFPSPGTIFVPSGQPYELNPDPNRVIKLTVKCVDATITSASMDPLP